MFDGEPILLKRIWYKKRHGRMALSSRKRFGQNGLQLTEHVYYIKL